MTMLVKVVLWMFVGIGVVFLSASAADERALPHVFVLISDQETEVKDDSLRSFYWAVPGRAPNFAAFLYGKTPLECGVVSDFDWRRKPVIAKSLADDYRAAGYHTAFFGEWGLGASPPYDPTSRGFDSVWRSSEGVKKTLEAMVVESRHGKKTRSQVMASMPQDQPWFCVIRGGAGEAGRKKWLDSLIEKANPQFGSVMVVVSKESVQVLPILGYSGHLPEMHPRAVWEVAQGLIQWVGGKGVQKSPYVFYHQGGWPLTDSAEKYRHRGSIVLGEKWALADGLKLFAMAGDMRPDKNHPMDLGAHVEIHEELLKAHGQWWQKAGKAIHHPRPFAVGEEDDPVVTLTALDWRPTKILHKDGSALASEPMVYQDRLLATLRGLRDNEAYKQSFPAYSGSWSVYITRAGRYRITARLLPKNGVPARDRDLAKLQGGEAHIKLGRNEVRLKLVKGATSVSVLVDAEAGVIDLECWFVGQLALERELGAFFVEIERVGEKKFELDVKTK